MLGTIRKDIVNMIASRHVADPNVGDALRVCRWANGQGYHSILSPCATPGDPARDVLERHSTAVKSIRSEKINSHLSVKLEAIGYDLGLG